jgi:tRNA modification GTPase
MRNGDTIVALSSGALPSGVAVVRLSGPDVSFLLGEFIGTLPKPRVLTLRDIVWKGDIIDQGLIAFFPGPHSFTGEDCAELQVHGSPAVVRKLLRQLASFPNVRLAEAGEFTRRAFENGKLNLVEVEGLGDLILAETENQRRQAQARLAGGLTQDIENWRERLLDARAEIEARLDFSDEGDVSDAVPASVYADIGDLRNDIAAAIERINNGRIIREGLRVALGGAPNAGKSSLLNRLAKSDIAIVTDEPGTTRDVREVAIDLNGQLVILLDMAGLRDTDSKAEAEGVRRARAEIATADLTLWLEAPGSMGEAKQDIQTETLWHIATKVDLGPPGTPHDYAVSSHTGEGLDKLLADISKFAAAQAGAGESNLLSRERDRAALQSALVALDQAAGLGNEQELLAEMLRLASDALARLLGKMDTEMVLDRLFSAFCIGK